MVVTTFVIVVTTFVIVVTPIIAITPQLFYTVINYLDLACIRILDHTIYIFKIE